MAAGWWRARDGGGAGRPAVCAWPYDALAAMGRWVVVGCGGRRARPWRGRARPARVAFHSGLRVQGRSGVACVPRPRAAALPSPAELGPLLCCKGTVRWFRGRPGTPPGVPGRAQSPEEPESG